MVTTVLAVVGFLAAARSRVSCGKGSDRIWTPRPGSVVVIEAARQRPLRAKENSRE
jgi:hypothetical protein